MSEQWYYAVGTEQRGPVSGEQIQLMLQRGEMAVDNLVWRDGMADWVSAATIAALHPAASVLPTQHQWAPPPPPGAPTVGPPVDPNPIGYATVPLEFQQLQSKASTAMVVGIISLVVSGCVCGPIGLGLGIWAWNMGSKIPPGYPFSGQGKTGFVCGIIATILGALSTLVQTLWFFGAFVGALT